MANKDVREEIDKLEEKQTVTKKKWLSKETIVKLIKRNISVILVLGALILDILILNALGEKPKVVATVTHTKTEKQISMSSEVMHEKGKEDKYWVHCLDDSFQVSKEDYDTYIKDYNTTTITEYTVKIKGKKDTTLGILSLPEKVYKRTSYVFKPADDYTKEEMKALKEKYIRDYRKYLRPQMTIQKKGK